MVDRPRIRRFDIRAYLDERGVGYEEAGAPNVGDGYIGVNCPFCDDHRNHLGIHLETKRWKCWRCATSGDLFDLMRYFEPRISVDEYRERLRGRGSEGELSFLERVQEVMDPSPVARRISPSRKSRVPLPREFEYIDELSEPRFAHDPARLIGLRYLENRGFDMVTAVDFELGVCAIGPYMGRLIVPVQDEKGQQVGFVARDMSGKARVKYLVPPGFERTDYLYSIHRVVAGAELVLVEGVTDVWCTGDCAVATLSSALSPVQLRQIVSRRPLQVTIMWDGDAIAKAFRTAERIRPFVPRTRVVPLPFGADPASLGKGRVNQLLNGEGAHPQKI